MKNLRIGSKLAVGFGILIAFLVIIVAIGMLALFNTNAESQYVTEFPFVRYAILAHISTDFMDARRTMNRAAMYASETFTAADIAQHGSEQAARDHAIDGQARGIATLRARIIENFRQLRDSLNADERVDPAIRDTQLANATELERLIINRYIDYYIADTLAAARAGDADATIEIVRAGAVTTVAPALALQYEMTEIVRGVMDAVSDDLTSARNRMAMMLGIGAAAAIVIAVLLALYISALVTKPLVASSDSLRSISEQLDAAVNTVNDSATTIAEASNQQAASIEETSATINESSSMIASNAENTRVASQLAAEAIDMANKGMQEMQEMSQTMKEINESSGTLGKIVKSIDDIAFQTNLLAINATVEAARAGGDAGRSFGVVAEEVRNLAQKSAGEAATTTDIIQKDITLTTTGREVSRRVLASLEQITEKTSELNKLIAEITAASEEQASGANQITIAIGQIEKSTQSNAATSQQSAASAAMLKELVSDLEKIYYSVNSVVYGAK